MTGLHLRDLTLAIERQTLIHNINYHFAPGTSYAILGDNGSGKTTLLRTLAGLNRLQPKLIFIDGNDLHTLSHVARAKIISFLLQHSPTQPYCSARDRIAHGLMPNLGYRHFLDENSLSLIENVARNLKIEHLLDRLISKLSGGEQRLIHLAKCLINPTTKILLLDEPSVFLDFSQQRNLLNNLQQQKDLARTVIFTSHDSGFIKNYADVILLIKNHTITQL